MYSFFWWDCGILLGMGVMRQGSVPCLIRTQRTLLRLLCNKPFWGPNVWFSVPFVVGGMSGRGFFAGLGWLENTLTSWILQGVGAFCLVESRERKSWQMRRGDGIMKVGAVIQVKRIWKKQGRTQSVSTMLRGQPRLIDKCGEVCYNENRNSENSEKGASAVWRA